MALVSSTEASRQLAEIAQREDDRLKKQGNGKAQIAFARDVKNSLLFQYDWAELLSAAPLALSLMGSCYVAATSPKAQGISLKDAEPKGGFKYIRHPELKACLVQVSDTGRFAFIEAEKKMGLINTTSVALGQYMAAIVGYLPDLPHPSAEMALHDKLTLLKGGSDDCLKYAQDIEKKFTEWLQLVCEVHQVTVAKEDKVAIGQQQAEIKIGGMSLEAELTQTTLEHANEAAKTLKDKLDTSKALFEKAANEVPGPWESMGLELAGSLARAATTSIAQALPAMMGAMAPAAGIGMMMGAARGSGGVAAGQDNAPQPKSIVRPATMPNTATDPAYAASLTAAASVTSLASVIGASTDGKVLWDSLSPGKGQPKSGIQFVKIPLEHMLKTTDWTQDQPSTDLKAAIEKVLRVIGLLEGVLTKDKELTSSKPDDKTVKEWQDAVVEAQVTITRLSATAQSLPGGAPGAAPMIGKVPATTQVQDPAAQNARLSAAVEKMSITQAAYTSAQDNYAKSAAHSAKVEAELSRIKANLKQLEAENIAMSDIKNVLMQCIGTLIQMKAQITNLVRFFGSLSAMVEHVVKNNVKDFVLQVDSARKLLIGNISLLDVSRQELYTTSLMCQAYFSLFSTIAKMYTQISIAHIMPGVRLCDELSKSTDDPNAVARRSRELDEFSDNAQAAVRNLVEKTQKEVTETLENRVNLVSQDAKMLPKQLPPAVAQAISDGKDTITAAAAQGFDNYQPAALAVDDDITASPTEI